MGESILIGWRRFIIAHRIFPDFSPFEELTRWELTMPPERWTCA
jgi:hypothetical protein